MHENFISGVKAIIDWAWSMLTGTTVPGFNNLSFAGMYIGLFIMSIGIGWLGFVGMGARGGNGRQKKGKDNDDER